MAEWAGKLSSSLTWKRIGSSWGVFVPVQALRDPRLGDRVEVRNLSGEVKEVVITAIVKRQRFGALCACRDVEEYRLCI